ncbi:MAG: undecaprenyl-phosphate glucose phosphotransferase [Kiloniellales bacterium]|nr:undecaprenyl-phosphate glucose phosphotransferase [Kiloniellales bacterium]
MAKSKTGSPKLSEIASYERIIDGTLTCLLGLFIHYAYLVLTLEETHSYQQYAVAIVIAVVLASSFWRRLGVYEQTALLTLTQLSIRIALGWGLTFAILLSIAFALKISANFSRVWLTSWFFIVPPVLIAAHAWVRSYIAKERRKGRFATPTAIVGDGPQALRLAQHLIAMKDLSVDLIGYVPTAHHGNEEKSGDSGRMSECGLDELGTLEELVGLIRRGEIAEVFVALPWAEESAISRTIAALAQTPVIIRLAPDLVAYGFSDRRVLPVAGLPMLQLFDRPISGWDAALKAAEDKVLAAFFLLITSPLLLVIAIAIKIDSPGPVFFKQKRYGFNQNLIEVWKFRSMRTDQGDDGGAIQAKRQDPRVTRVGAFIRRTSLDELPQFFNVLGGSMSIVGPRPHPLATRAGGRLFEDVVENYAARHRVKPGITGWAQVNGWRGETDTEEKLARRIECDLYYIDNWSIWLDLWIILKTALIILRDRNAY